MIWILIVITVIGLVYTLVKIRPENTDDFSKYTVDSPEVDWNFVDNAMQFFDTYLSFCKKHKVMGIAGLARYEQTNQNKIKVDFDCDVIAVDDEHADEAFESMQMRANIYKEGRSYLEYSPLIDSFYADYYGCEKPHWVFTEPENFTYERGSAHITFEGSLFTLAGARWKPTISVIIRELQEKWPNAEISSGPGGMSVKYK